MTHNRLIVLALLAIIPLTLGGCGRNRELAYAKVQIAELERQVRDLERQLAECEANKGAPPAPVGPVQEAPTGFDGVDIHNRGGETVFAIDSDVLFKPGSDVLNDKAKTTLSKVIAILNDKYKGYDVRVEGHTDDQPIKRSKDKWSDNWDLSGGRAISVLHYLHDKGVPAKELSFLGYGEFHTRASNATESGRAKNRRVEIVAIPKR